MMNNNTAKAFVGAGVVFALYSAIVFLIPFERNEVFWLSFGFTAVAFLLCCYALYMGMLKEPSLKSKFYGFAIAKIGCIYVGVQVVLSLLFMILAETIPLWLAGLLSILAFGVSVVGIIGVDTAVEQIENQDRKLKAQISAMKTLQLRVSQLASLCREPAFAAFCEELRYSDPVSSQATVQAEEALNALVDQLQQAIDEDNAEQIQLLSKKATYQLTERNRICKLSKSQ